MLLTLANCNDLLNSTLGTDIDAVVGDRSYANVVTRLREGINSKMYPNGGAIPMWGQTSQIVLQTNGNSIELKIMRAVARVDAGIGTRTFTNGVYSWSGKNDKGEIIPFEMTDLYIISPNNAYGVIEPQSYGGGYPVESVLTKLTPLYLYVVPYIQLNVTPESRSAQISFANLSLDATKGGTIIAAPKINLTQYAPMLQHISNELPIGTVPGGGGTYNVVARTNMQGWGVKMYSGASNTGTPIVTKPFGPTPTISAHEAAVNRQVAVAIPANPGVANRTFSFWLYCDEFLGAANEIKFAEKQQVLALDMTIPTTTRYNTEGTVSQIVINDPGNVGWTVTTSGGWLVSSNISGANTAVERSGFGNSASWYVYVTQNMGEARTGTVTLKTQGGSVIKTITITQAAAVPQFTSFEGNTLDAQGTGKLLTVTTFGNATLSVNNGFRISDTPTPGTSRTLVSLTKGVHRFYITSYERFGNGNVYGVITLTDGIYPRTTSVIQHTCISNVTVRRLTTTYFTGHTDPGASILVKGNNMKQASKYVWIYSATMFGSLTVYYDDVLHKNGMSGDQIPYCEIFCPLNAKKIGTLPAK